MTDELEIIDVASEEEASPDDGAAGEGSRGGARSWQGLMSPEARRARLRMAAGVVLTLGVLGVLLASAYASWAVASVRHIDRLVAEAIALDREILVTEATWTGRLLPEEKALRTDFEAELGQARSDLRALAEEIGSTRSPPDTRVAAYRDAAADAIRNAAAGSTTSPDLLDGDVDTPLANHPVVKQARAATADRWPLLSPLTTTDERQQVLSRPLRERLPDPDVLFAGHCECRLRAVTRGDAGGSGVDGIEIDLRARRHGLKRQPMPAVHHSSPLGDSTAGGIFRFALEGDSIGVPLRNGDTVWLPRGSGHPYPARDAVVFVGALAGSPSPITVIDLDDGRLRPIEDVDGNDRVVDVSGNALLLEDWSTGELRTVDITTLAVTRWDVPSGVTRVEEASVSPDNAAIAIVALAGGKRGVAVVDRSGSRWLAEGDRRLGNNLSSAAWTPDGRWVFWLQGTSGTDTRHFRWIRGARADGSAGPFTVRAAGHYRAVSPIAS